MLLSSLLTLACGLLSASASALPHIDDFGLEHDERGLAERGLAERGRQPTITFNPRFPQQCGYIDVSWTGQGPFELQLGNWRGPVATKSGFLPWEFHEGLTQTSWRYQVPFPPGAVFMAQIKTADGWTIWRRATVLRGNKNCNVIETWSEGPPWPTISPDTRTSAPTQSPTKSPSAPPPSSDLLSSPTICWVRPSDVPSGASSFQLTPTPCESVPSQSQQPTTTPAPPTSTKCWARPFSTDNPGGGPTSSWEVPCGSPSAPPVSSPTNPPSSSAPPFSSSWTSTASLPPLPTAANLVIEFKGDPVRCQPEHIVFSPTDFPATLLLILDNEVRTISPADDNGGLGYEWNVNTTSKWLAAYLYDKAGNYGEHPPVLIAGDDTSCIK